MKNRLTLNLKNVAEPKKPLQAFGASGKFLNLLIINKVRALLITSIIFLPLSFSNPVQAGKYYKWVDEHGATHYTEKPPADTDSTAIRTQGKAPKDAEQANAKLTEQREALAEDISKREEQGKEVNVNAENDKIKKENCKTARNNLKTLEQHGRIKLKGEDGEYTILPEEKRQERIQTAKDRIKEFCN